MIEPFITIIMPALNEERNIQAAIRSTLAAFDAFGLAGEVLVINDGSTDRTGPLVEEEIDRDSRVSIVQHLTPEGVGASFWDGVTHARGQFVCTLPGDNENDPHEIMRYCSLLEHVDIVIPYVFDKQGRSLFRNALSFLYRLIVNTTFLVSFNYTNGTVIYRKRLLDELPVHSSGFFFQTDILVRLARHGYLFAEVPYRLNDCPREGSKAVSLRSLLKVARAYLCLVRDIYFDPRVLDGKEFAVGSITAQRCGEAQRLRGDWSPAAETNLVKGQATIG